MTMEDINNPRRCALALKRKTGFEQVVYLVMVSLGFRPRDAKSSLCGNEFQLAIARQCGVRAFCAEASWKRFLCWTQNPLCWPKIMAVVE